MFLNLKDNFEEVLEIEVKKFGHNTTSDKKVESNYINNNKNFNKDFPSLIFSNLESHQITSVQVPVDNKIVCSECKKDSIEFCVKNLDYVSFFYNQIDFYSDRDEKFNKLKNKIDRSILNTICSSYYKKYIRDVNIENIENICNEIEKETCINPNIIIIDRISFIEMQNSGFIDSSFELSKSQINFIMNYNNKKIFMYEEMPYNSCLLYYYGNHYADSPLVFGIVNLIDHEGYSYFGYSHIYNNYNYSIRLISPNY